MHVYTGILNTMDSYSAPAFILTQIYSIKVVSFILSYMFQLNFPVCLIAYLYISISNTYHGHTTMPHESDYVIGYIALLFVCMFHCFPTKIYIIDAKYITFIV